MRETIVDAFDKLVSDFSWRRLLSLVLLIAAIVVGVVAFDRYTGYFRLQRLQRGVELLAALDELGARPSIMSDSVRARIHYDLLKELEEAVRAPQLPSPLSPPILKAIAGAAPWLLLMSAFLIAGRLGSPGAATAAVGVLLFVVVFGAIGMLIPTFVNGWVNYLLYPLLNFIVGLSIVLWYGRRTRREPAA